MLNRSYLFLLLTSVLLLSFFVPGRKTKVYIIGDSTAANKEVKAYPETGWGMAFKYLLDSTIELDNRAKNGRSTKSFLDEKLWEPVTNDLKEGDYVIIQFGHNDEGKEKVGRYTTPEEFKANLLKYVIETREKKAVPILVTPVARRRFDEKGELKESHPLYSDAVRETAKANNVLLIDLDVKSMELYRKLGVEGSKLLFNHLLPNQHPNYPEGKTDDTHFSELGARMIAEIVTNEIKSLNIELSKRISPAFVKK
jgi:lysophospholipase L1-like esterase